ncbi:surfactin family lipopeptide synthetase A [Paenibacillus sp. DS2015]|uniref:amino acid adenylation domain-containing protein n=1 Tax=Paenibacillus sp. DS2015 TaxID=3373917 RepID=UPI003D1EE6AC
MVKIAEHQIEDIYPMSDIQQGMAFYSLKHSHQSMYHEQFVYQLKEPEFQLSLFQRALELLVQKHSILRTSFHFDLSDVGVQLVHRTVDLQVEEADLRQSSKEEQEMLLQKSLSEDLNHPFPMDAAPLWRAKLYYLGHEHIAFCWIFHHAILDGWSAASFITELVNTYLRLKENAAYVPETLECSYKDYIIDQMVLKENVAVSSYWKQDLEDYKRLELPIDKLDHEQLTTIHYTLDSSLQDEVKQLASKLQISIKAICFTAYVSMANMLTYESDILVGLIENNRPLMKDGDKVLGCFLNTIPFRFKLDKSLTWETFVMQIDKKLTELKLYGRLPLFDIVNSLEHKASVGFDNPLFDTYFNFTDFHIYNQVDQQADVQPLLNVNGYENTNTWLDFAISSANDQLSCTISYKQMKEETVQQLLGYFIRSLQEMTEHGSSQVTKTVLLPAEMTNNLQYEFNQTFADYPREQTIHQLFEEQVERTPNHVAVISGGEELTYCELNKRANRLARALCSKGVQADQLIGIMVDRSIEMVIGLMAILKSGGAYVPIDPAYPEERIQYMLEDSQAKLLLTQAHLLDKVRFTGEAIDVANRESEWNEAEATNLGPLNGSKHLAYVIYTSGSTGNPKGVMIEHRSVINFLQGMKERLGVDSDNSFLSLTTLSFDIFALELYLPLCYGMKVVIASEQEALELRLQDLVERNNVDVIQTTPSRLQMIIQKDDQTWLVQLKKILIGGEASTRELIKDIKNTTEAQLYNMYGPTESTIWSTVYEFQNEEVYIGSPIANTQVYIVDAHDQLQPIGVAGELCIAGDGLARGYVNQLDLTAEKFIVNPFVVGERMYRTGDLARWLPNGMLDYIGRMDQQVKIRGHRIEIGEIEAKLLAHMKVQECAVIAYDDGDGHKALCAYIAWQGQDPLTHTELKAYLAQSLPEYMIPSAFVPIERLPLTSNGKIDRKALPSPQEHWSTNAVYAAPRDKREETLASIWQDILGVERVGIHDDFFELGGHSLKAMSLAARIHKELKVDIPLRDLFTYSTLEAMAEHMGGMERSAYSSIEPVPQQAYYLVSSAQKRIYVLEQLEGLFTSYNMSGIFSLKGNWDKTRLATAFIQMTRRHDALRTSFAIVKGEPVQHVHPSVSFEIEEMELGSWVSGEESQETQGNAAESKERAVRAQISRFIRPFDLSQAPLLRVGLIAISHEEAILLVDMHHIISDGVSMDLFVREWLQLYRREELLPLRIQYKDYAAWQGQQLQGERMKQQETYWLQQLGGELPVLNLPTDYLRPVLQSFEGDRVGLKLERKLTQELKQFCAREGVTLSMALLAAYQVLISKYSGQEDVIVGVPIAGRPHADLGSMLGMFVNTLAMRSRPEGEKTFLVFLREVREDSLQAYEHQEYPFEQLVEQLHLPRDLSRNPVFDVLFVMQNIEQGGKYQAISDLSITPYPYENRMSKFDLTLQVIESETIELELEYATQLFTPETAERIIHHFKQLLTHIVQAPENKLSELELLSNDERQQLLEQFNDTAADYQREQTIHGWFEDMVDRIPDRVAVKFEEERLTYRQLNERANQLARMLRTKGVEADTMVGIIVERSLEMIIGVIAILKAGGAFVPVDPLYPDERIQFMLENCATRFLLTTTELVYKVPARFQGEVIEMNTSFVLSGNGSNIEAISGPEHLLYVIYTSGTTGKPKGVMLEHRNLVNLINFQIEKANIPFHQKVLQSTSMSFDVCYQEIFSTLLAGGELHIVSQEIKMSKSRLLEYINERQIQVVLLSTSYLKFIFGDSSTPSLPSVSHIITAGEQLIIGDALQTYLKESGIRLHNHYGPSETHVITTHTIVPEQTIEEIPPIGKPIHNTKVYIVSPELQLLPIGIVGELCVSGVAVGRGYLQLPELTAEKFISHPFILGERMYRTGDLARWLPDGRIEYVGRSDQQVKVRGHRIEIGEIESKLLDHDRIREAVILAHEETYGQKVLCAYVVTYKNELLSPTELRAYLGRGLPEYMIPTYFMPLEKLPLTFNGKIDRHALPKPDGQLVLQGTTVYEGPRNAAEETLVQIWQDILGVEKIGVHDPFFELGGHSLKAIQAVEQARQNNLPLSLKHMMKYRTIHELSEHVLKVIPSQGQTAATTESLDSQHRKYNKEFLRPEEYPYYYPCSIGAVMEKLNYEQNLRFPKSLITNSRGDGLLFYKYYNNHIEDRIVYHSSQPHLDEMLELPSFFADLNVSFSSISFDVEDEALEWCAEKLVKNEVVIVNGTTYYLPYSHDYYTPKEEWLEILNRSDEDLGIGRSHIYVLVDMTEHECIVYDSSFNYFGAIKKEEFKKSFAGIGKMAFIDHPAQKTVVPHQVIEINTDKLQQLDMLKYATALLRRNLDIYLHSYRTEVQEEEEQYTLIVGLDAISHLMQTIRDFSNRGEYELALGPFLSEMFNAWKYRLLFIHDLIVDLHEGYQNDDHSILFLQDLIPTLERMSSDSIMILEEQQASYLADIEVELKEIHDGLRKYFTHVQSLFPAVTSMVDEIGGQ